MEFDVVYSRLEPWKNNLKGLNRAIEVLVVDGIFIMPVVRRWLCHLVSDKEDAIFSRVWLNLCNYRACPRSDGRLHSDRWTKSHKCEVGDPGGVMYAASAK